MKKYNYLCDGGSLRIFVDEGTLFYSNGYGDGIFEVYICRRDEIPKKTQLQGSFIIVKEGWLMFYDCYNHNDLVNKGKQHKFTSGIYSVYLDCETCTFYIYRVERRSD